MIEVLKKQTSTVLTTLEARRHRELAPVHHKDRRAMRKTPREHVRSEQLNMRISPRFRQRVAAEAVEQGISVTEVLVRAFDHFTACKHK